MSVQKSFTVARKERKNPTQIQLTLNNNVYSIRTCAAPINQRFSCIKSTLYPFLCYLAANPRVPKLVRVINFKNFIRKLHFIFVIYGRTIRTTHPLPEAPSNRIFVRRTISLFFSHPRLFFPFFFCWSVDDTSLSRG